ncbi:MAG: 5-formyltetrahydrofolate cyclo-ligase [Desulfuromonadales bacterium]|nr:5-formyltetrahydrofolate cyclo-ligase [Desulfuromonadales bacterium]
MPKRSIRTRFLAERRSRPLESCISSSAEIQLRFLQSELFHRAECLALYSAIHNEVLTETVSARAFELGKTLVYPRIKDDDLEFVEVLSLADLTRGAFGVLEPQGDRLRAVEELDLVVVPGVAFDQSGHRLGYGRGFYDRTLSACRADCAKVGLAYDSQLLDTLPVAEHDQKLSVLMTESRTLNFTA